MREILFRAKSTQSGEWVEGFVYEHLPPLQGIVPKDYIPEKSKWFIVKTGTADWNLPRPVVLIGVDGSTVGRSTGLCDKNGTRIFEGDVVGDSAGLIIWNEEDCSFNVGCLKTGMCYGIGVQVQGELEIIGNIHDNPELFKEVTP